MTTPPTLVLLHGAGTGSWVWQRVLENVQTPAIALDVPGRAPGVTPAGCAEALVREIDDRGIESVVPVLHSLAGVLASEVARGLGDRLAHCVFVSGVIPPPGGSFLDAVPLPNRLILRLLFRLNRNGLKPSAGMIRRELCNDLSEEDAALVVDRYEAEMPGLYVTPAASAPRPPGWAYVKLLQDRSVTPAQQDAMIARLPEARRYELDAGHLAMLSNPEGLSEILVREAAVVGHG
ncbi:MAG: alpha/beta fold hydrolase [Gemmatimonadota bacterium]